MRKILSGFVTLFKDVWYVIRGMFSWRGLLALFISFMVYEGWAFLFIVFGTIIPNVWMTTVGTAVVLMWVGPGTPLIPIIVITALGIQRFIFRERNPRYKEFMTKYKGILKERKRRKKMQRLFDFGEALKLLKEGKVVARMVWNVAKEKVYLVPANIYPVQTKAAKKIFQQASIPYNAYFAFVTVDDNINVWEPTTEDCLADDWFEVYV